MQFRVCVDFPNDDRVSPAFLRGRQAEVNYNIDGPKHDAGVDTCFTGIFAGGYRLTGYTAQVALQVIRDSLPELPG